MKELHRDQFLDISKGEQQSAPTLLRAFFQRLREAGQQLLEVKTAPEQPILAKERSSKVILSATLEGLTLRASQSLPFHPMIIDEFTFHIGRVTKDPLSQNDLMILDDRPFQLSRHHVTIFQKNGRLGVSDRGSTLGGEVDGRRFGGRNHSAAPVYFERGGGILVLGSAESPFRYKVTIEVQRS